jgi:WD40 repeat protein
MHTTKPTTPSDPSESEAQTTQTTDGRPQGGPYFDWIIVALSAWWLGGLYLDGWAHRHVPALETFFTPWHAILYSGFAACALALLVTQARNMRHSYRWNKALPAGYGLSLVGAAIFLVAGALDLLWHTLFGIERSVEALLSPTHLLLATGGVLLASGPLRATWCRLPLGARLTWQSGGPALLSLLYCYAALGFFTQYAHPFVTNWAADPLSGTPPQSDLYLMRADGSGQTRLTTNLGDVRSPSFSPDGSRIVFGSAASAQATLEQLYMVNADGSGLRQLTFASDGAALPNWSPDGERITFTDGASGQIGIMDADGTNSRLLTHDAGRHCCSAWSPDATRIVYIGPDGQIYTIDVSRADARATPQRLTQSAVQHWTPRWSPGGARIAFSANQDGNDAIYVMSLDGSDVRSLTARGADSWGPVWSPDGSRIAFATNRDGHAEIYVMRADGSDQKNLTRNSGADNDGLPAWSADGRSIAYAARRQSVSTALDFSVALGVASVLLQAALLMGVLLLALRRWRLPFGAITLLLVVSTALIGFLGDQHIWTLVALVAGLLAEALYAALRPSPEHPIALRIFSFSVPALLYGLYFLWTYLTSGQISWSVHLTAGTAALAGVVGLLLSIVLIPPEQRHVERRNGSTEMKR